MAKLLPITQPAFRYQITSPEGAEIEISEELFIALRDFMDGDRPSGTVIIHFRNGGIAGLESCIRTKLK